MNRLLLAVFMMILQAIPAYAVTTLATDSHALYPFATPIQQERFYGLTAQLRCLVCQNQSLADSNAPFAQDMREQIFRLLNQGQTDQQIIAFLTKRYGDFVRYQPPFKPSTLLLWVMPFAVLIGGILIVLRTVQTQLRRLPAHKLIDSTNSEKPIAK